MQEERNLAVYEWQLIDVEAFGKGPTCPVYEVSSEKYCSIEEAVESAREYAKRYWKDRGDCEDFEIAIWKQPDNILVYHNGMVSSDGIGKGDWL